MARATDSQGPNRVDEHRAAVLLGLSTAELRRLSRLSGVGHLENPGASSQMIFTYEELRQLCLLSTRTME